MKSKESTISSDMSEQDSEPDTSTEDEEGSQTTETLHIHNVSNTTMHDEDNSSESEDDITRLYPSPKILLVLYSCEKLLTIHTTYQSAYFIDYVMQDNSKYPRIMKIHQVQHKLQTQQF